MPALTPVKPANPSAERSQYPGRPDTDPGAPPTRPTRTKPTATLAPPTIAVVLDETGSMMSVKAATVSSYNEYLSNLQADKNNDGARFALTRFNTARTVTEGPVDLAQAPRLTDATYQPAAMTDLYDAIGKTITRLDADAPSGPVIVVILTDGEENSSKEFTRDTIKTLINEREATKRWSFIFLGAGQDAWVTGGAFGIQKGNAMSYVGDSGGTIVAMRSASRATSGITRDYHASGGTTMSSTVAFASAGIDHCLACGGRITFDAPHVCASK